MCKYSSSSSKVEVRLYKNYLGELNETCEIICENVGQIKFIFIKTALSRDALIQLLAFAIWYWCIGLGDLLIRAPPQPNPPWKAKAEENRWMDGDNESRLIKFLKWENIFLFNQ